MRFKWRTRGRWAVVAATLSPVVALAVAVGPPGAAAATGLTTRAAGTAATGPSTTMTLITGDVVRVTGKPGHQSAQIVQNAHGAAALSTVQFRRGKDLYVIPGEAVPLVATRKLDENLFDVSELARDGYTRGTLPVLVTYTSTSQAKQADTSRPFAGATVGRYLWSIKGLAATVNLKQPGGFFDSVTVKGSSSEARAARQLTLKPGLTKIWLDAKVYASPIDVRHVRVSAGTARAAGTTVDVSRTAIGADTAWAAGDQGVSAKVAILDTGIDATHPDFAGQIGAEQNFVPAGNPGGGNPSDVTDRFGHGTHVAGIIAGTGTASGGLYSGVAPKAQLVIGKVLDDTGAGDDSWIIAGMQWAATQAKVINMSLGTHGSYSDGTDPLSQALNTISNSTGALFVVAAGNDGQSPDGNPYGGPGSCAQCIEAPGAATDALTVGAITDGCDFDFSDPNSCTRNYSTDAIPYFSSTGPRLNDLAIKPDITAPGVDVPSARASGTSIGTPVAAYPNLYTYLSGTSMATPMVAGSAAILAGEHPTWTAQQLRDALTSTATPNSSEPLYWQGAGMVNVGKAATQTVFGTGELNLGTAAYPQAPGTALSGTITYTNTGTQPETLTLSSSFATAPQNFDFQVVQKPWTPPAGAVTLPSQVTIPAGGTQTVTLSIDASQAPYFSTYGQVTATAADGTTVQTTVGFTRAAQTHTLTLTALDRTGTPENSSYWSYAYLMDLTNGQLYYVSFHNGDGIIWGTTNNELIASDSYALLGQIGTFSSAPYYRLLSWTQFAEPQITMNTDRSFTFDARNAGLTSLNTQQPGVDQLKCSEIYRSVPTSNQYVNYFLGLTVCGSANTLEGEDLYTLAGGQATTGTFQHTLTAFREQAPITVSVRGLGARLLPRYPYVLATGSYGGSIPSSVATDSQPRFPASARLRVADVGAGTPAEIAAANVAGKIALLHPPVNGNITGDPVYGFNIQLDGPTVKAIAAAGAAGILIAPPADGIWKIWYNQVDVPSIPAALLSYQEAAQLSSLLTAGRTSAIVASAWPSPYTYFLRLTQPGQGLTNGASFSVRDRDLARVTTRYHGTAGQFYAVDTQVPQTAEEDIPAQTIRTEMYTPGANFAEYRNLQINNWWPTWETTASPTAAGHYEMNVGSGPWVPVTDVTTYHSYTGFPSFSMGSSAGYQDVTDGWPTGSVNLVCHLPACQQSAGGGYQLNGDGLYQVIADESENTPLFRDPLSVSTHTVWTIHVHLNNQSNAGPVTQPVMTATWYVEGGLDNVVPTGSAYAVRVVPSYPAGVASQGPVTARLWASYDDGTTWVPVPGTQVVQPGQPATFALRTPAHTNGFVGYRVQMSDASGNAIDQTVIRAAYTQPPA